MPRTPKKVPTTRLTLDLAEPVRQLMESLRDRTQAETLVEVVRRALAVYSFVSDEKAKGSKVIIRDKDGERELVLM